MKSLSVECLGGVVTLRSRRAHAVASARAERSRFAQLLDRAVPGDARVAEVGCGTGQMSLYLSRADRIIVAADLSRSLLLGASRRHLKGHVLPMVTARMSATAAIDVN
jgi:ubiquinone/menaquinone biosynthesis C-methylase UbiE